MLKTNTPSGEKVWGSPALGVGVWSRTRPDWCNHERHLRREARAVCSAGTSHAMPVTHPTWQATADSRNPEVPNQGRRKRQIRNQARSGRQAEAGEFILWRADDSCGASSRVVGASIQQEWASSSAGTCIRLLSP